MGAVVGYGAFHGLEWIYQSLRGRAGLGQGDAKLLAAGGAWLGIQALPVVTLCAALAGLAVASLQARRQGRLDLAMMLPFRPCLAFAIWLGWIG